MGDLVKGTSFSNGQQILATDLNDLVDNATIGSGVVGYGHLSASASSNIIKGAAVLALADISNDDYLLVWSSVHGTFMQVKKEDFLSSVVVNLDIGGTPLVDPATNVIQVPIAIQGTGISSAGDIFLTQNKSIYFSGSGVSPSGPSFISQDSTNIKVIGPAGGAFSLLTYGELAALGNADDTAADVGIYGKDTTGVYRSWVLRGEKAANSDGGNELSIFSFGSLSTQANDAVKISGRLKVSHGIEDTQGNDLLADMTGDSGSGGASGMVPAPASGDATNFLRGDGTWAAASGGGGATTFPALTDTPAALGTAGQYLKMNSQATALEWTAAPAGGSLSHICEIQSRYYNWPPGVMTGVSVHSYWPHGSRGVGSIMGIRKAGVGFTDSNGSLAGSGSNTNNKHETTNVRWLVSDSTPAGFPVLPTPTNDIKISMTIPSGGSSKEADFRIEWTGDSTTLTSNGIGEVLPDPYDSPAGDMGWTYPPMYQEGPDFHYDYGGSTTWFDSTQFQFPERLTAIFASPTGNTADECWVDLRLQQERVRYTLNTSVNSNTAIVSLVPLNGHSFPHHMPRFEWAGSSGMLTDFYIYSNPEGLNSRADAPEYLPQYPNFPDYRLVIWG